MKAIVIIPTLFLFACATTTTTPTLRIQWHKMEDPSAFCARFSHPSQFKLLGCAFVSKDGSGICHIYAPDFTSEYTTVENMKRQVILGHEVKHCFDGAWHRNY